MRNAATMLQQQSDAPYFVAAIRDVTRTINEKCEVRRVYSLLLLLFLPR